MPGTVTLRVAGGPLERRSFAFKEHDTFIFGRAEDCHARLALEDTSASRHHFLLEVNPPEARLRDLGSLNGTYVNGTKRGGRESRETPEQAAQRRFPEVDLHGGDRVEVGDTVFLVEVEVPPVCAACGRYVDEVDVAAGPAAGGSWVCRACRASAVGATTPRRVEPPRCQRCAKDVSAELPPGRRGDYVCQDCQRKAAADPVQALIREALEEAGKLASASPAPAPLPEVPGHAVERKLGQGAMGAVYRAIRLRDRVEVALKVMLSRVAVDARDQATFLREASLVSQLRHPNVVEFYEQGSVGAAFYFTMELCQGGSLDGLMARRGGRLTLSEAAPIMLGALEGLCYSHQAELQVPLADGGTRPGMGVVHRDLKPQNILLAGAEGRWTAKISDYGLAKCFSTAGLSGHTVTGSIGGTCAFMPREQIVNYKFVGPLSDVWSLGATFYNLLTGYAPRDFPPNQDPIAIILRSPPVPIRQRDPRLDPRVAEVIDHALLDDTRSRIPTAAEFRAALTKAL